MRAGYSKLLQKHGYQVETAESVAEGWKKVTANSYDIAIIDYLMPVQNGTALITMIRNNPETQHILTATITGTYSDAVIAESLACGALECLFKSESKDLLLARLASLARTINDQKAIDKERRRLQDILSSVGEGVYGVDAEGVIQFVNPAALELLGYSDPAELVGQCAFHAFHYADEDGHPMQRARVLSKFLLCQRQPGLGLANAVLDIEQARHSGRMQHPSAAPRFRTERIGGCLPRHFRASRARTGTALAGRARQPDQAARPWLVRIAARAGVQQGPPYRPDFRCSCSSISIASSTSTTPPGMPPATACWSRSASA